MMKKVKLQFTHKDGDGLGCALPLRFTEDLNDFIVIQCSLDEVDSTIESYLDFYDDPKNPDEIEAILITDITPSPCIIERLEYMREEEGIRVWLIDHHENNNLEGLRYDWMTLEFHKKNEQGDTESAAYLVYETFKDQIKEKEKENLFEIINEISRYDTWEWKNRPKEYTEEYTTILINLLGFEETLDIYTKNISNGNKAISEHELKLINGYINKRNKELEKLLVRTVYTDYNEYRIALFIVTEEYHNNEHELIYNSNDDVDITVGIIPKTRHLSFRTKKDDINVGRLAKRLFNGGGRKKSAGTGIMKTEVFLQWLQKYYDLLDEKEAEIKKERKLAIKQNPYDNHTYFVENEEPEAEDYEELSDEYTEKRIDKTDAFAVIADTAKSLIEQLVLKAKNNGDNFFYYFKELLNDKEVIALILNLRNELEQEEIVETFNNTSRAIIQSLMGEGELQETDLIDLGLTIDDLVINTNLDLSDVPKSPMEVIANTIKSMVSTGLDHMSDVVHDESYDQKYRLIDLIYTYSIDENVNKEFHELFPSVPEEKINELIKDATIEKCREFLVSGEITEEDFKSFTQLTNKENVYPKFMDEPIVDAEVVEDGDDE